MFGKPGGVKYPLTRYAKVRNYVLGALELGDAGNLTIEKIHRHFVSLEHDAPTLRLHMEREHGIAPEKIANIPERELAKIHGQMTMPADEWEYLLADPVGHDLSPTATKAVARPVSGETIDEIYASLCKTPRDLDKHLPTCGPSAPSAGTSPSLPSAENRPSPLRPLARRRSCPTSSSRTLSFSAWL
jgi:hypothetical protein